MHGAAATCRAVATCRNGFANGNNMCVAMRCDQFPLKPLNLGGYSRGDLQLKILAPTATVVGGFPDVGEA